MMYTLRSGQATSRNLRTEQQSNKSTLTQSYIHHQKTHTGHIERSCPANSRYPFIYPRMPIIQQSVPTYISEQSQYSKNANFFEYPCVPPKPILTTNKQTNRKRKKTATKPSQTAKMLKGPGNPPHFSFVFPTLENQQEFRQHAANMSSLNEVTSIANKNSILSARLNEIKLLDQHIYNSDGKQKYEPSEKISRKSLKSEGYPVPSRFGRREKFFPIKSVTKFQSKPVENDDDDAPTFWVVYPDDGDVEKHQNHHSLNGINQMKYKQPETRSTLQYFPEVESEVLDHELANIADTSENDQMPVITSVYSLIKSNVEDSDKTDNSNTIDDEAHKKRLSEIYTLQTLCCIALQKLACFSDSPPAKDNCHQTGKANKTAQFACAKEDEWKTNKCDNPKWLLGNTADQNRKPSTESTTSDVSTSSSTISILSVPERIVDKCGGVKNPFVKDSQTPVSGVRIESAKDDENLFVKSSQTSVSHFRNLFDDITFENDQEAPEQTTSRSKIATKVSSIDYNKQVMKQSVPLTKLKPKKLIVKLNPKRKRSSIICVKQDDELGSNGKPANVREETHSREISNDSHRNENASEQMDVVKPASKTTEPDKEYVQHSEPASSFFDEMKANKMTPNIVNEAIQHLGYVVTPQILLPVNSEVASTFKYPVKQQNPTVTSTKAFGELEMNQPRKSSQIANETHTDTEECSLKSKQEQESDVFASPTRPSYRLLSRSDESSDDCIDGCKPCEKRSLRVVFKKCTPVKSACMKTTEATETHNMKRRTKTSRLCMKKSSIENINKDDNIVRKTHRAQDQSSKSSDILSPGGMMQHLIDLGFVSYSPINKSTKRATQAVTENPSFQKLPFHADQLSLENGKKCSWYTRENIKIKDCFVKLTKL